MSDNKETKEFKLKPAHQAISDTVYPLMHFDKKEKKIVPIGEAGNEVFLEKTLPEHLTMKIVEDVSNHMKDFSIGMTHALGRHTEKAFKDNKDIDTFEVVAGLGGKDDIKFIAQRNKITHSVTEPTVDINNYNNVSFQFNMRYGKIGSDIKNIRAEANALAMAALSK